MGQNEYEAWAKSWGARIGKNLKNLRKVRGFRSAEDFALACADAGLEINRSTIANIESGRKRDVPVTDLVFFAYVLGVSPLSLLFGFSLTEEINYLPNKRVAAFDAARVFSDLSGLEDSVFDPRNTAVSNGHAQDPIHRATRSYLRQIAAARSSRASQFRALENVPIYEQLISRLLAYSSQYDLTEVDYAEFNSLWRDYLARNPAIGRSVEAAENIRRYIENDLGVEVPELEVASIDTSHVENVLESVMARAVAAAKMLEPDRTVSERLRLKFYLPPEPEDAS